MVHAEILEPVDQTTQTTTAIDIEEIKRTRSGSFSVSKAKVLRPFNTSEVKILLLENINETAIKSFTKQGYQVKNTDLISFVYILYKI
jgi:D-3-phosphoglycerate dehydrogenase